MDEIEVNITRTESTVVEIRLKLIGGWKLEKYTLYQAAGAIQDGAREMEPDYPETAEVMKELSRSMITAVYSQDQIEKVKRK
jgi:hypothetical protein